MESLIDDIFLGDNANSGFEEHESHEHGSNLNINTSSQVAPDENLQLAAGHPEQSAPPTQRENITSTEISWSTKNLSKNLHKGCCSLVSSRKDAPSTVETVVLPCIAGKFNIPEDKLLKVLKELSYLKEPNFRTLETTYFKPGLEVKEDDFTKPVDLSIFQFPNMDKAVRMFFKIYLQKYAVQTIYNGKARKSKEVMVGALQHYLCSLRDGKLQCNRILLFRSYE
eukprot:TRINITY_DN8608_c0_g1_i1.p1 TRINITY_DN8608_c0_g1~~TRINITY_DN8608_c0_g1_i1.p1  ORF type:complete len:225 (-),score=22.82 TRINITY_DN8608_c0_g1_i1:133-807(-)